ncbi:cis-3-hydroxy-L-proline dehydratase [Delftia lacustris]|uniref:cis-3-hydroxy-L-proline dehydratase n=1 Tax=Delftia lacustris TaxID=558537 RepID=UPI002856BAF4|nr:aconitase family protein [Delftia lacustris]MDR6727885.1 putative aconitase/putative aconitase with swiveling domain [Delftia lacustris]
MSGGIHGGPVRVLVDGAAQGELLHADTGLSFWGGVDPATGRVIDSHHPLHGQCLAGRVLALPSGRGSCTGSSVMMELIRSGHAPAALVLAEADDILTLGVVLAQMMYGRSLPVVCLGSHAFSALRGSGFVRVDGHRVTAHRGKPDDGFAARGPADDTDPPQDRLRLDDEDRAMLEGRRGKAAQMAMRIVVRMARLQGARELVSVSQVHIDGCIYTGPSSLEFARQWVQWGARMAVPTTLNAISVDQRRWRELGVAAALGEPAGALGEAYMAMGARLSYTCAPYLLDTAPAVGEQIAWAESNAVVFANSVLGARTLKYPDYLDLCIALCGRAPLSGCHLDSLRQASLRIAVQRPASADDAFYPLLGYHVGLLAGGRIPLITGLEDAAPGRDDLKAFSAAFGTTSSAPLFHIAGITPEALHPEDVSGPECAGEPLRIDGTELVRSWEELNSARDEAVDLVSLGNPHFSLSEFARLAVLCQGRRRHPATAMVITCGREVFEQARQQGHIAEIERFGATVLNDTCWCMLGEPVIPPAARTLMTNSAKFAHYAPGLVGRSVHFAGLAQCVQAACSGRASRAVPPWLCAKAGADVSELP